MNPTLAQGFLYRWCKPPTGWWESSGADDLQAMNLPAPLGQVLAQRGHTTPEAIMRHAQPTISHLHPPEVLKGMTEMVARLQQALSGQEPILIYADYDVDGTTAAALMAQYFRHLGVAHACYQPHRLKEGYGISEEGIRWAKENGYTLVLALDCGIRDVAAASLARSLGLHLLVVDHHLPGEHLPDVVALIDPHQPGCAYPDKDLPACALAFKLVQALEAAQPTGYDMTQLLDLVALAIACDIVPMRGENRTLAALGLQQIAHSPRPGLRALMDLSPEPRPWTVEDLVFFLGPRLNAAGRLAHAQMALQLLTATEAGPEVQLLAQRLDEANAARRAVENAMTDGALHMADQQPHAPGHVLWHPGWHKGVVGIVAAKVAEHTHRPVLLLAPDAATGLWAGSGRSVPGVPLNEVLAACQPWLLRQGGHAHAVGLTAAEEHLPGLRAQFQQLCEAYAGGLGRYPLQVDALLPLPGVTSRLVQALDRLEPYGPGALRPVFMAQHATVTHVNVLKGQHLRLTLSQQGVTLPAIGFGLGQAPVQPGSTLAVAYTPRWNLYRGQTTLQLELKDLCLTEA